jgi:hypothetical protein
MDERILLKVTDSTYECADGDKLIDALFNEKQSIESMARKLCTGRTINGQYVTDCLNSLNDKNKKYSYQYEDILSRNEWYEEITDIVNYSLNNIIRNNNESIVIVGTILINIQNILFQDLGYCISTAELFKIYSKILDNFNKEKKNILNTLLNNFILELEIECY